MNMKLTQNRTFKRMLVNILSLFVILAIAFPATTVTAANDSLFVGQWRGTDPDGSEIRLAIGGRPEGPFQITWTESYIGFCDGEAGIVRGTDWLNESAPNLLEADLHLECFTTGATLDFHIIWRYHPATNTLSSRYDNGVITIWHRPGHEPEPPPALDLRINYGDDWVESFYEDGHTAWITVTESDGMTVKATAELMTEPKEYWGWESGFQSMDSVWFDADGNQMGSPPNIRPNDWVFGWVDNGASAQVQIGEIRGVVDVSTDSIQGTILVPWFSSEVNVECHPWGAPEPTDMRFDKVLPDGDDLYSCSWAEEWDTQPGQPVGVGYFGEDGHWVANVFRNPRFDVFPEWNAVEGWEWPEGKTITATVAEKSACTAQDVAGYLSDNPWSTFTRIDFPEDCDIVAGDIVLLSDGTTTLTHTIQNLAITSVDKAMNTVTGSADDGALVYAWVHGWYEQTGMQLSVEEGTWLADFNGFDLVEGMCGRSEIRDELGNATSVDWCIPNPTFTAFPQDEYIEGWNWQLGANIHLTIDDPATEANPDFEQDRPVVVTPWDPNSAWVTFNFAGSYDMKPGDVVTLTDELTPRTHTVQNLAITEVNKVANTVEGTADDGALVYAWVHGFGETETQLTVEDGIWFTSFNGFDLLEGMCGRSEIRDDIGNSTADDWCIPNPHFSVFPEWEYIEGWDWPDGALVSASIAGKNACIADGYSGHPDWDPSALFVPLWFPEGCDVVVGDEVALTDGLTPRVHTVQNLAVTAVDAAEDIVSGTADAGVQVHVWPHGYNELLPTTEDGNWTADFTETGPDLVGGMAGRTEIRDDMGNATAVEWYIPSPRLIAFPVADQIFGYNWPEGSEVSLTVNGEHIATANVQGAPWDPNDIMAFFDFGGLHNLVAGDVVTLSGSGMELTYTVQSLSVTEVNADANTVTGAAKDGALVYAGVHEWWDVTEMQLTAEDGTWLADFGLFDLAGGMCGRAEIRDEFGSNTAVDWCIPNSRIVASITEDWFYLVEFAPETTVNYSIYESQDGTQVSQGTATTDSSGFAWVDAEGRWNLEPGNYVVVSDGTFTKDLVIEGFTFDVFDLTQGILQGTVPGPEGRHVWVGIGFENDAWTMDVTTDPDGNWSADFGAPVPTDYQWVAAQIFDEDGDASELRPASQIMFLRPSCGDTYTAQAGSLLEIRYGSWIAIGEDLANQNAEHLTVSLTFNEELLNGVQQPVVPGSGFPCGMPPENAYGVFYVAQVAPLSPGTYVAQVTWSFDEAVTDGYDADGDGEPEWYGPGEVFTREFTIIVQ